MRKFFIGFISFFSALIILSYANAAIRVGEPAPDFILLDSYGKQHKLSDYSDKVVVLEWTDPNCSFVRKHYDSYHMQMLQKKYIKKGVVWLTMISADPNKVGHVTAEQVSQQMSAQNTFSSALLFDSTGKVGRLYGAETTPHMYIINQGQVVYMGGIDNSLSDQLNNSVQVIQYFQKALNEVLEKQPVSVAHARPYGCRVKY